MRVVDASNAPGTFGYRILGRAARSMISHAGISNEVFEVGEAVDRLVQLRGCLSSEVRCSCLRCGSPMHGFTILVHDADQA